MRLSVSDELANETIQWAVPATDKPDTLTWSGTGGVPGVYWDATDPMDQANEQNAVLLIGVLFGIWGSVVVVVIQFALRSWVHGQHVLSQLPGLPSRSIGRVSCGRGPDLSQRACIPI